MLYNLRCLDESSGQNINSRDQLEGVMNEAGSVLKAQSSMVYSQQLRQGVPAFLIIMDNIISIHVTVELHPVNFLIQRQHIWV